MDRATYRLFFAASLTLAACKGGTTLEEVCKSSVFVGRAGPGQACLDHGSWAGTALGDVGLLEEFCEYQWIGDGEPDLAELPDADAGVTGLVESCPRVVPQADAFAGLEDLRGHLYDAFMGAIGRISVLPHVSDTLPRVYIVDTIPESLISANLAANDPHGQRLRELLAGILCDDPAACPSLVANTLGLPRITPELVDRVRGGSFGSLMDLARGIDDAVKDWEQHGKAQHLVLALAVGWEPLGAYGPDLADKSLAELLAPGGAATDVQAVLAALTRAACHGALMVAAVGNSTGEPCVQTGVMGPAMLASLPSPTAAQCEDSGFAHDGLTENSSLLLSVSHLGLEGQQLGNVRADAPGGVQAQGSTFSTPGGDTGLMTGSSVATIVSTAAATALWAVYPELNRADVITSIQDTVDETTGVRICSALQAACERTGDEKCAARFDCPDAQSETDAAIRELSSVLQPPCSPHDCSTEIELSAPFPADQSPGVNACGVPLTMYSPVQLPEVSVESSYPWTTPQPRKPYCPTCLAEISGTPQQMTAGISLMNVPASPYPLFIEVETAAGAERYPVDPNELARGDNSVTLVHIKPEFPWSDVRNVRLLYYVKSSEGRWHLESEPLLLRIVRTCGNGTVENGEECDDGNASNNDACSSMCKAAECGDGIVRAGVEECDDGNQINNDACSNTCTTTAPTCGNGVVEGTEECDDGNQDNQDFCADDCVVIRSKVMVCGSCTRPVSQFFPTGYNWQIVNGCVPDDQTQALFVTRDDYDDSDGKPSSELDSATLQAYVNAGGIILTEYSISDDVWGFVFGVTPQMGEPTGSGTDTIPSVVRFNLDDKVWQKMPFQAVPLNQSGMGYTVNGYAGITLLTGWAVDQAAVGYRDLGQGRVYATDFDWQDNEQYPYTYTQQLMGYFMTHRN